VNLVIPERAQLEIEKEDAGWRDHRRDARELFTEELAAALDEVLMQPEVPRPYRKTRKGIVRRVLMPKTRRHVYYVCIRAEQVVVIVTVWGAVRGKKPNLSLE
jgi:hypothetical protein